MHEPGTGGIETPVKIFVCMLTNKFTHVPQEGLGLAFFYVKKVMQNKLLFPEFLLFYPFILTNGYLGLTIFYISSEFSNFSIKMSFLQKYSSPTHYNQYSLRTLTQIKQPYPD